MTSSRGDGLVETHRTVDYGNTFTLTVEVLDTDVRPVDGAVVTLYGPVLVYPGYEDYWWYAAEGTTGSDALAHITLGENNAFALRVDAPIGSNPPEENYIIPFLETSTADQDEFYSITIDAESPSLNLTEIDDSESAALQLSFSTRLEHRPSADSTMLRGSFSRAVDTGRVDRFVVDAENYARYLDGEPFEAFAHESQITNDAGVIHLPADGEYLLVLANDQSTSLSAVGSTVAIVTSEEQIWEYGIDAISLEIDIVLQSGEHAALSILP